LADLFKEIIPSLNNKKNHMLDEGLMTTKEYNSFIINKNYSFGDDILFANMMNMNSHLSSKMQYDFYFYGLDNKSRYNKWIKKQSINSIDDIKKYCGCSYKKALQYADVLSAEQLDKIKEINNRMEDSVTSI